MNACKPGAERGESLAVLVIDDDHASSHNLDIQLRFVGECPLLCGSDRWQQALVADAAQPLLAVVLGNVRDDNLPALLQDLERKLPQLPILQVVPQVDPGQADAVLTAAPPALRGRLQQLDEGALSHDVLAAVLRRAREQRGAPAAVVESRILSTTGAALFRSLSGKSRVMQQVRQQLQLVAKRDVTVLLLGESGTGKEVVARNLHYHSGRGAAPFIAVSCAAIAPDRYGVELFGESDGPPGLLESANGGTVYLDEVAELPLNIQTLLLRFLEDRYFHRSGSGELVHVDVRMVAGTAQNLQTRIRQGQFRADLYYRLNLMPIELPPLRKRLEDIPELVQELLHNLTSRGYTPVSLNASAIKALQQHRWPGNVRELANLIERLCIIYSESVVGVSDLPREYRYAADAVAEEGDTLVDAVDTLSEADTPAVPAAPVALVTLNDSLLQQYLQNFEKQLLQAALDDSAYMLGFAAERLAIDEAELKRKLQSHQLEPS